MTRAIENMLSEAHNRTLTRDSAISSEVIAARQYESVSMDSASLSSYAETQRASGLLIPGWTVWGEKNAGQLRRDQARVIDQENGKSRELRYETPHNSTSYLDIHPFMLDRVRNTTCELIIGEGVKKGDALVSQDVPCISLLGVWNWRGKRPDGGTQVLADFDEINWSRVVVIAFDGDVAEKKEVKAARDRLGALLHRRGAKVFTIDWSEVARD